MMRERRIDIEDLQMLKKQLSPMTDIGIVGLKEFQDRLQIVRRAGQVGFILVSVDAMKRNEVTKKIVQDVRKVDTTTIIKDQILVMLTHQRSAVDTETVIHRLIALLSEIEYPGIRISGIYLPYAILEIPAIISLLHNVRKNDVAQYPNPICLSVKGGQCIAGNTDGTCAIMTTFNAYMSEKATVGTKGFSN